MATYTYKATDMSGSRVNGVINSTSESSAVNSLSKQGLMVLSIDPVKQRSGTFSLFPLKLDDLMTFARQLAIMLNSGVNLAAALEVLAEQEVFSGRFRKIISTLLVNIESGMSFAEALRSENCFDDIFVNLVDAGENSGSLENTLDKVARFYESQKKLKDEVKSATTYPMFILVFGIIMVIVVMFFILPKLAESFGGAPSGIMATLMDLNIYLTENWLLVTIVLISAAVGLFFFFKSNAGKATISYILGIVPGVKQIRVNSALERYCRTLSVMIASGVDIIKALRLASNASDDPRFVNKVEEMSDNIKEGMSLENAFSQTGIFPGLVIAMVGTGERTGKLDDILEQVADFFEDKVRTLVKQVTSIIEPSMIVLVGLFMGFIAYAMYSSIFQGQQNITGGF
jgi:type IV pilus assembly protein PilC